MPALQVRLLGHLELSHAGKALALPATRKAQALLAYLTLHRRQPQPRERLAEIFWGDRPDEKARRSLSTAAWHINHCLPGKDYLLSSPNTLQFNPQAPLALDTEEFESLVSCAYTAGLRSAIQLYRGEFLAGSYEDWIIHERYRLENLYLDGLARLMAAYEAQAEYAPALETALSLLDRDPLREDAHCAAMRLYSRLGKRNAALEQYQRCQQVVRKELGVEPMLETTQVYLAILEGQLAPQAGIVAGLPQPEGVTAQRQPGSNPLDLSALPPFLGRESEMAQLDAAWQRITKSQGALALIQGEAGVGKTRLVEEFSQRLRWKGVPVLWGRCYEFERILPYQPVAEALRSVSTDLAPFQTCSETAWFVQEVFRLVPELAFAHPELSPRPPAPVETEQARLFEGVRRFLLAISQPNGLLMVIEDLHWAAESTFEILHYLARHLAESPILILCTMRPEEVKQGHPLQAFQAQLKREGLLRDLHLERLSPGDMETLVLRMSGQGEATLPLARRLYQETEGNPFFLMEIIKALFDSRALYIEGDAWAGDFAQISASRFPLPARLSDAVRYRVQQLDDATQEAISVAAVIGREFDFELLKDAWQGELEKTLQALDVLLRRRLVEEGSGSVSRDYSFTHHKIQEVVYEDIPLRRRDQIHARIGGILEGAVPQGMPDLAGELAYHFLQSRQLSKENRQKAIRYLLQAGDQARLIYAHKEAIGYYHQALELLKEEGEYPRRARVNMKLGVTYHNAFEYEQAHHAFEEGFRLWQKVSQVDQPVPLPAPHPLRTNWQPITSLDPAFAMDFAGALAWQLFCGLVTFSPDMEIIPDAAYKWELYSGGREYVFRLRDGLRWSDGKPVTAHDFEYAGKRMLAPENRSPFANLLYDIKGARPYHLGELPGADWVGLRAADAATLTIELEKPAAYFLQLLVNFLAVPRHCVEAFRENWTEAECVVTSGPFNMQGWKKNDSLLLVRNPAYHGQHTGNIQQVWLNLQRGPRANVEQYAQDALDVLDLRFYPVTVYENTVRQFVDEYIAVPAASLSFLGFNVTKPPFQDRDVRRAFALAIDKEALAGAVQRGAVFPATGGYIPPGLPGHQPGIGLPYDPMLAKDLLGQAGYPGWRGFPKIKALTPLHQDDPFNEFLSAQWEEILGIKVAWRTVSPGLHLVLESEPPDMFISYWHADYPDPDDFLGASQLLRWTGWRDETYLSLLQETRSIADQTKRMAVFHRADRLLMDSAAVAPLTYNRQHYLLKPWVRRYPTSALYSWFWKDVIIEPH